MTTKYHVNREGNPGKCSAQNENCPFGGSDNHYATAAEANKAYEAKMSQDTLRTPSTSNRAADRRAVALNPRTPSDVLMDMTDSDFASVLSDNPSTPLEAFEKLAKHKNRTVRYSVAQSEYTPRSVLASLASDKEWVVRSQVAANTNTPVEVLQHFAKGRDGELANNAKATLAKTNVQTPISSSSKVIPEPLQKARRIAQAAAGRRIPVDRVWIEKVPNGYQVRYTLPKEYGFYICDLEPDISREDFENYENWKDSQV